MSRFALMPTSHSSTARAETIVDADFIESWDEYWFTGALWASRKSKDPRCRVGALIVHDGELIASGFNGLARNVFDDPNLLGDVPEKLKMICHAEANAIFNAARRGVSLKGATIYVTKFPCLGCCNAIVQSGIARIYTQDNAYWNDDPADTDHSRKKSLLRQTKVLVDAPFHPDFAAKLVKRISDPTSLAKVPPPVMAESRSARNIPRLAKRATTRRAK